jgi:RND family efflux transporter MFP subunit
MNVPSSAPPSPPPRSGRLRLWLAAFALLAIALAAWGIATRVAAHQALARQAADLAVPTVAVTSVQTAPPMHELVLPGSVEAYKQALIYARVSGYLKRWYADIGATVKAGQLLAEIDAPELDQQLRSAQADVETAAASAQLATSTAQRWQQMYQAQSVSKQDLDDKIGAAAAAKATLDASRAKVEQLRAQVAFERVVAPFDGVVTARKTDIGALIDAGSASGAELFEVADTRRLRVYVHVPQTDAAAARPGLAAQVQFAEYPGRSFQAKLVSDADALDPATRTLLAQLEIDNRGHELLPGGYAEVHLQLQDRQPLLRVPASTLLFRGQGLMVASVGDDGVARLHTIVPGRDLGTEMEVLSGVRAGERLIVNPPDSLLSGTRVRVVQSPGAAQ